MEDYYKEMEILMMRIDLVEDHEATMVLFLHGLRPDIAEQVELQHFVEITDLVEKAIKVEQQFKRRGTVKPISTYPTTMSRYFPPKRDNMALTTLSTNLCPRREDPKAEPKAFIKPSNHSARTRARHTRC